jgi:hypothetical protein
MRTITTYRKSGRLFILRVMAIWTKPLARRTLTRVPKSGDFFTLTVGFPVIISILVLHPPFSATPLQTGLRRSKGETPIENHI